MWGWTPFVDPDPMLSYFTCDQVSKDPKDPTNYYNDANWCDTQYDALYKQQKVELDQAKRVDLAHQMLTRFYESAVYDVLYTYPDLQAYRKDRFTGWIRQPEKTGPVLFSNTLADLRAPEARGGGHEGRRRPAAVTAGAAAAGSSRSSSSRWSCSAAGGLWAHAPAHRRRARVSARFVTAKVLGSLATLAFVVAFNFFLFRVVEGDPVANLFRGRNLSQSQRAELTKQFGLDGSTGEQFVRYVEQTAQLNLGRSYTDNQPVASEIWRKAWPTIALVGISTLLSTVFGVMLGIAAGVAKTDEDRLRGHDASRWRRTRCPTSGSGCCC